MNAVAIPAGNARSDTGAPQLRTILLTDLCDSTQLVERLGDSAAADLFRQHDLLVLQLQQQWRGRLIDRSDGLLLLFERPIDGLGFALDYARGLRDLGREQKIELKARAGLHVGEVLTWRNSDEAVRVGAKPLEVEGLAKPMAARLMTLARPGQVLVSAIAEPLAHRSARELGERGQQLLWKSHGRWRFKGVPTPQEIFEVGEAGIAPLSAPKASPKAWRDIPLWRRPAALIAEIALVLAFGLGLWFVARPQPAIAFNERDWVVVADLRNLTGQPVLDDSLEQAFRISLEQSRYVNVLSDLKVRDTLRRMQRKPDSTLDRSVASEVALRDGARAVILPTIAEIGGHVRVSAEIIDPTSQTTVYAESMDGVGVESVLGSIDAITAIMREKLGETVQSIEQNSVPLPEVTTGSLDALRAYALAQKAYGRHEFDQALRLYQRATQLDPGFALAWLGQVRVYYSQENAPAAIVPLRKAQQFRKHLPPREALYLDAWVSEFDTPADTTDRWLELAKLYPDYLPGRANAGLWLYKENRFEEALAQSTASAIPQNPLVGHSYDSIGRAQLGLEQYDRAQEAFKRSYSLTSGSLRRLVATAAAKRDFSLAHEYARQLSADDPFTYIERTGLAIDEGRWQDAQLFSQTALKLGNTDQGIQARYLHVPAAVAAWLAGDIPGARSHARIAFDKSLAALTHPISSDAKDDAAVVLGAALLAQRLGEYAWSTAAIEALEANEQLMRVPQIRELTAAVRAGQLRRNGNPEAAIKLLQPFLNGKERFQTRVALMEALIAAGELTEALRQARWLQTHRGRAYIEMECGHCLQAMNVADSTIAIRNEAELLSELGKEKEGAKKQKEFDRLWSPKDRAIEF